MMKQCPCPGAKDSPLDEAELSLIDEGEGAQEDREDSVGGKLINHKLLPLCWYTI